MNAHIDELAKQAGLHREWYIDNPEIEKFAELIVRECAEIANNNYDKGFCPVGGFIEDHFELGSNPLG